MRRAGVIGLGAMGAGIAANLVKSGYETLGVDPDPAARDAATTSGVQVLRSAAEVAECGPDVVFVVVRSADQVEKVLFNDDALTSVRLDGAIPVVVASTISPSEMRDFDDRLRAFGLVGIGAGLSGGPWGAQAGTLTWVVSGPGEAVESVRPLLEATGTEIHVVSTTDVRVAHAAKLGVQLIYGVNMFGVFEALRLGAAFGLDPDRAMALFTHSVATSWIAENWDHVREWWEGGGNGLEILVKDMRSIMREADSNAISLPVTGLSFDLMRSAWSAFGTELPPASHPAAEPVPWTSRASR